MTLIYLHTHEESRSEGASSIKFRLYVSDSREGDWTISSDSVQLRLSLISQGEVHSNADSESF